MGMLRVISSRGDDRVQWNEQDALSGVRKRSRRSEKPNASKPPSVPGARRRTVYILGKQAERIEQFDPQAAQIILVPRVAGG